MEYGAPLPRMWDSRIVVTSKMTRMLVPQSKLGRKVSIADDNQYSSID